MTFSYEPRKYTDGCGFLKVLFAYKYTAIPSVMRSGLFCNNVEQRPHTGLARTLGATDARCFLAPDRVQHAASRGLSAFEPVAAAI